MLKGAVPQPTLRTFARACAMAFAILLFFSSCAGTSHRESSFSPVYVTDTKKLQVLPPRYMNGRLDELQFFSGNFSGRNFYFQTYIQADKKGLSLTILNEMGFEMGSLSYTETDLSFSSSYFPQGLKAEYMLLDLQNCYYDVDMLRESYAAAGLEFSTSTTEGTETRRIQDGDTIIEEITIEKREKGRKDIRIANNLRSYSYELRTIAQ